MLKNYKFYRGSMEGPELKQGWNGPPPSLAKPPLIRIYSYIYSYTHTHTYTYTNALNRGYCTHSHTHTRTSVHAYIY